MASRGLFLSRPLGGRCSVWPSFNHFGSRLCAHGALWAWVACSTTFLSSVRGLASRVWVRGGAWRPPLLALAPGSGCVLQQACWSAGLAPPGLRSSGSACGVSLGLAQVLGGVAHRKAPATPLCHFVCLPAWLFGVARVSNFGALPRGFHPVRVPSLGGRVPSPAGRVTLLHTTWYKARLLSLQAFGMCAAGSSLCGRALRQWGCRLRFISSHSYN